MVTCRMIQPQRSSFRDLNDDPWDPSVREVLKAVRELRAVTHPSNTAPEKEGRTDYSPQTLESFPGFANPHRQWHLLLLEWLVLELLLTDYRFVGTTR